MSQEEIDKIKQEAAHKATVEAMKVGAVNDMFTKNPILAGMNMSKVNPDNFSHQNQPV